MPKAISTIAIRLASRQPFALSSVWNGTRLPKVTSMNFCSAAKPVLQRSRSGFTLSGKARGAVEKRQSGGQKGATGLWATASEKDTL